MIQKITLKYVVIASFIFGVMFTLSFGIYGYSYYDIYLHRNTTGGIVEKINLTDGTSVVKYTVDDITVKKTMHFIDTSVKEGDSITIYYDKRSPGSSFIYEQAMMIFILFLIGIFSLCVFVVTFIIYKKRPKKKSVKTKKKKSVKVLSKK